MNILLLLYLHINERERERESQSPFAESALDSSRMLSSRVR